MVHYALHINKSIDNVVRSDVQIAIMKPKSETLQIRIADSEKDGFELAALLSGISLSSWVRERLRLAAIRELEGAGRKVPFVPEINVGGSNARD